MINLKSVHALKFIEKVNARIDKCKSELEKELGYLAQGAMIRAKTRWFIQEEHSNKYFLTLQTFIRNYTQKIVVSRLIQLTMWVQSCCQMLNLS